MSDRIEHNRTLALTITILFLGMSLSVGLHQHSGEILDEEPTSMETHSGLNMPGSTVGSIFSLTALGASYDYTCVVLDNNEMKCWGSNYGSFLGISEDRFAVPNEYTPVSVNEVDDSTCCLSDVIETSPDGRHSVALTSSGDIYAWGEDYSGQIGHGHISCFNICDQPHGPSAVSYTHLTLPTICSV